MPASLKRVGTSGQIYGPHHSGCGVMAATTWSGQPAGPPEERSLGGAL